MTERKTRVQRLEEKLAQARADAEKRVRVKPLKSLLRRMSSIEVHDDDNELLLDCIRMMRARIEEIEGAVFADVPGELQ